MAEVLALKAKLQFKAKTPNTDANKTFSQAVQLHDSNIAWGLWAEHLVQEHLDQSTGQGSTHRTRQPFVLDGLSLDQDGQWIPSKGGQTSQAQARNVAQNAASALAALLQACRQQNDQHCRKYMANVIYCLCWDNEPAVLDVLDQVADSVPAIQWLSWIPQLTTSLCRSPPGMTEAGFHIDTFNSACDWPISKGPI